MQLNHIVYLPAIIFCAVSGISWAVSAVIELRERGRRMEPQPVPVPAMRPAFRPVVIEGGLAAAGAPQTSYFRGGQTPLRSPFGAALSRARSYGG